MEAKTINVIPKWATEVFHASQNDNGREIRFNLYDGLEIYQLTGNESLVLRYKKPNGNVSSISVPNPGADRSYVDVTIPEEMTDVAGFVYCKLRINGIGVKSCYLAVEGKV